MLKQLIIQNLAIAENVTVEFHQGLNVITGETGAGKSLLVDALCLLRGEKIDIDLIRTGCESAQVTGVFSPDSKNSPVFSLLEDLGIPLFEDEEGDIIVKRFLQKNGRHRASINENTVSSKTLRLVAAELIDISSQFENQRLLDSESHTFFLDEFCKCGSVYKDFLKHFIKAENILKKIKKINEEKKFFQREKELYEFELKQIQEAELSLTEFTELERILQIGHKAHLAQKTCLEIEDTLANGDINCLTMLKSCRKNIEKLKKISDKKRISTTGENLSLETSDVDEIIALIESLLEKVALEYAAFEIDNHTLATAQQRMEVYNKILQKYGKDFAAIEEYKKKCEEFISRAQSTDRDINLLIQHCCQEMTDAVKLANELEKVREANLFSLTKSVKQELEELGMPAAALICQLEPASPSFSEDHFTELLSDASKIDLHIFKEFSQLSKTGKQRAHFLLTANVGMEARPIEKVASGGELSRVMLAIKNVLFGGQSMSVFVFDEIDTGLSGHIASRVGKKLAEFCRNLRGQAPRQAICITHLPQVACHAHNHYFVSKLEKEGKTTTRIRRIEGDERLREIATMLSGEEVTKESLAQAKVLIELSAGTRLHPSICASPTHNT